MTNVSSSRFSPRLLIVANLAAGRGRRRRLGACLDALAARECRMRIVETEGAGDAERIARDAAPGEFDAIVAAGGDGTANEVINGLGGKPMVLGLIPLGTANVLAAEIGQDPSPGRVAETITAGARRRVHLGQVNGRRFLLMAGAGFDAEVVARVDLALKRRAGRFAYAWGAVACAPGYPFPPLEVRVDGVAHAAFGAMVCKSRHYAGRFVAAPLARMDAETFQVCLLKRPGWANVLRYGAALLQGRLANLPDVEILTARRILVTGPIGAPVQGDGDVLARLPAAIEPAEESIELIVPKS